MTPISKFQIFRLGDLQLDSLSFTIAVSIDRRVVHNQQLSIDK